jgi:hypothetical protein
MVSRLIFLFSFVLFFSSELISQNIPASGGELTYEYIGDSSGIPHHYAVNLIIYKTVDTTAFVPLQGLVSSSCFSSQTINFTPYIPNNRSVLSHGGVPIDPSINCDDTLGLDSTQLYGYYYSDTLILGGLCPNIYFSYRECCRSFAITNIARPDTTTFYLVAALNNMAGNNKAIKHVVPPRYVFCKGTTSFLNIYGLEPDGDSVRYDAFAVQDSLGILVAYDSGYSPMHPITAMNPGSSWLSQGLLAVNTARSGVFTVVLVATEFRYILSSQTWVVIGSSMREINIIVRDSCPPEVLPSYSGGLIPKDTLSAVNVNDSVIGFATNSFFGYMLANDGSQFRILGPDTIMRPLTSAFTTMNAALLSDTVWLSLHKPIDKTGFYVLIYKDGGLFNACRNEYPLDGAYFVAKSQNTNINEKTFSSMVSLYPNPTRNNFTLVTGEYLPERITLFDIQGKELKSIRSNSTKSEIDISEFAGGVYLLKVDVAGYQVVRLIQKM